MRFLKERFEMTEGEVNRITVKLAPVVGANTLTDATFENSSLTITSESHSGTNATALVAGGTAGRDYIVTVTATLSSGETKVGAILLEWKAPGRGNLTGVE